MGKPFFHPAVGHPAVGHPAVGHLAIGRLAVGRLAVGAIAAGLCGCTPASIGITGPGVQANRPEVRQQNNNASLPVVGVPNDPNGYAPSVVPTTGPGGRYYGY